MSLIMISSSAYSQKSNYFPYASVGTSVSSGIYTYGVETGIYNQKAWFAVGASAYKFQNNTYWTGSFKTYFKLQKYNIVDVFAYNSVNVSIDKYKTLGFEPGFVTVFNFAKKWAPQVSLTAPVYENTNFKFTALSFGVSLNYWIK